MAKYDVTYMCGHEETMQLYGPCKERQRKIEYYRENMLCPECYKKEKEKEKEEAYRTFKTNPPVYSISITDDVDFRSWNPLFKIVVTGNTIPIKDELKKIGYNWDYEWFDCNTKRCWIKRVPMECLDAECRYMDDLGARLGGKSIEEILNSKTGQRILKGCEEYKAKKTVAKQAPEPFDEKDADILLSESPDC